MTLEKQTMHTVWKQLILNVLFMQIFAIVPENPSFFVNNVTVLIILPLLLHQRT